MSSDWLAVIIGNSRLHWAYFHQQELQQSWDSEEGIIPPEWEELPLYLVSVVEAKNLLFQQHMDLRIIKLEDIPLKGIYSTMGVDRALALWGAMQTWGYPCLVIDGGTALTLTGANNQGEFSGGAILPGLRLQLESLATSTASLPRVHLSSQLPLLWAKSTPEAIQSGVIYTVLTGIKHFLANWWKQFPKSPVIFTGGDGEILSQYLIELNTEKTDLLYFEPKLIFWGLKTIVNEN
ncbi:MAG: pantothenate kinase [Gloeocapsa sp. DLM2.Bin57]|nr:MAG: pantothenate kinase [Gloeocapsa sp. DLM2.Bin57]